MIHGMLIALRLIQLPKGVLSYNTASKVLISGLMEMSSLLPIDISESLTTMLRQLREKAHC